MTKVAKNYPMDFYRPDGPVKIKHLEGKYTKVIDYFNTTKDDYLDKNELWQIRNMVHSLADKNNGKITFDMLADIAKKIGTDSRTLMDFLHQIHGATIGNNIYNYIGGANSKTAPLAVYDIKKWADGVSEKNIEIVNYVYSKHGTKGTVIDDMLKDLNFGTAKPIIQKFVDSANLACKSKKIDVSKEYAAFNKAMKENDKKNIAKFGNEIFSRLQNGF